MKPGRELRLRMGQTGGSNPADNIEEMRNLLLEHRAFPLRRRRVSEPLELRLKPQRQTKPRKPRRRGPNP